MTHSPKRLLLTAISVIVLALAAAPMSFAGEDDPGPTQAGETQGPSNATTLATRQGPSSSSPQGSSTSSNNRSSNSGSSSEVLGTSVSKSYAVSTKDTVRAKGGIQAGLGGMATEATPLWIMLPGIAGVLLILGAGTTLAPVLVRSRG
jgi:hypothetical protein